MLTADPVLSSEKQQRFNNLISRNKPFCTHQISYLPSYWLAREVRRRTLIALVATLSEEPDAFWQDVVRWYNLQPLQWWLRLKAHTLPAQQIVEQEVRAQRELAVRVCHQRGIEEKS